MDREAVKHNQTGEFGNEKNEAFGVCGFLTKKPSTKIRHPPQSPNLARCNYLAIPKTEKISEGSKIC